MLLSRIENLNKIDILERRFREEGLIHLFYDRFFLVFLNNSETIKAVNLAFSRIKYLFIRDIHAKFDIPNASQFQDIGQN